MTTENPPQSRTAYVVDRLKSELARGTLSPGDQLRQSAIAKRYGVSATPVREALRILAADGTIDYTTHRGATVRDFSPEMAHDLYRMRAEVEALAVQLSMARMSPAVLASIRAANEALIKATAAEVDPAELSRLNRELHFAIYDNTSPVVTEILQYLWARFKPNVTLWGVAEFAQELTDDHAQIIDAIDQGDAATASDLMRAHVLRAYTLRESSDELRAAGTETSISRTTSADHA